MPTIRVELLEGRTADQKRALAKALTEACVRAIGVPATSVDVLLYELPKHHWASGGVLRSEASAPSTPPTSPVTSSPAAPASAPAPASPPAGDTPAMPLAD